MSVQAAIDYLSKAVEDEALLAELEASPHVGVTAELAKNHGFDFSSDELEQAVEILRNSPSNDGELTEQELAQAAGGVTPGAPTILNSELIARRGSLLAMKYGMIPLYAIRPAPTTR